MVPLLEQVDLAPDQEGIFEFRELIDALRGCLNALVVFANLPLNDAFHDEAKLLPTVLRRRLGGLLVHPHLEKLVGSV